MISSQCTVVTKGFISIFHSLFLIDSRISSLSRCVSANILRFAFLCSTSWIISRSGACDAPSSKPEAKIYPDRPEDGISQNRMMSKADG